MRALIAVICAMFSMLVSVVAADGKLPATQPAAVSDFVPIFDGKTLNGWHVSGKTGHGTGGKWYVDNGAIVGTQDKPGNGGIVITDAAFGDFEVSLEMGNDFGPDSGLFLRSTENGRCYQAMIDYHSNAGLMGVYGEGIGGFVAQNFIMLNRPEVVHIKDYPPFPCPFTPEQWPNIWSKGWNNLRARITGNPPTIHTWINGLKIMEWKDDQKRLDDRGSIALQIHGGGDLTGQFVRYRNIRVHELDAPDNTLSPLQKAAGWALLFDGKTLDGWKTNLMKESKVSVEDGCIQPHGCGGYMMVPEQQYENFILSLDFKMAKDCNSGIFVRTYPLTALPGQSVGYNGLEMQILDSPTAGMGGMGAIYDLVAPRRNAAKPIGEWNHAVITCDGPNIIMELNGEQVSRLNLDEWSQLGKRPDGSAHKFTKTAWKNHPRRGYIGLQDHGAKCWYKNIKILPLPASSPHSEPGVEDSTRRTQVTSQNETLAIPTPQQAAWQDYEIGMFLCMGPNTWQDREYDDLSTPLDKINPSKLDAEQWIHAAEDMGAKYIVFVAKHTGGFCLWQTETTDYSIGHTTWRGGKGDMLADLAASCKKHGMPLGVYVSPADLQFKAGGGGKCATPEAQAVYDKVYRQQLTEVLSRYGEMMEVWFDGSLVIDVSDILAKHAPKAMVFQGPQATIRWVGNENGTAPYPAWNSVSEKDGKSGIATAKDGDLAGTAWLPNECDARIRKHWFWNSKNAGTLKSVDQLMKMYYESVGHGAVLLLNHTPDTTGLIPEADVKRGAEFGAEIKRRFGKPIAETIGRGSEVVLKLKKAAVIEHVIIMEDITQGERIREYTVDGQVAGKWQKLSSGTAVGHKKIDRIKPATVTAVRLKCTKSAAEPIIRKLAAYGKN